ncbi:MAG TPA: dihydropteroate synthase [Negativicutes bacterium]
MNFNPRILEITNLEQAKAELAKINCDPAGIAIMAPRTVFKTLKLENIPTRAAGLLKQTFLSKGGEVAVSRDTAGLGKDYTDVLICATIKQYKQAVPRLKAQPWGLAKVAQTIESILTISESFPERHYSWPRHTLAIVPKRTLVMGILNVTPDSFSDGGKYNNIDVALRHVEEMIRDGADIIDVGAESTRPYNGANIVSAEEEMNRLLPLLEKVLAISSVPVSVDTYKASVAEEALKMGAHMINDVWGLQQDPAMAAIVAKYGVPVFVMHNQEGTHYERDIMAHICSFLRDSIAIGVKAGIHPDNIIIDPGIGFGKTPTQNIAVMARLEELKSLGCPILLATSRKRFIGEVLNLPVEDRVEGTGATIALGIMKGSHIIRVHDVKPLARIAKMTDAMIRGDKD